MRTLLPVILQLAALLTSVYTYVTSEIDDLLLSVDDLESKDYDLYKRSATEHGIAISDLAHRLDKIEGSDCENFHQFNCGFPQPKCIAHYLVCDGHTDCPNGADESSCGIPFPPESTWVATSDNIPYYTCLDTGIEATRAQARLIIRADPLNLAMPLVESYNLETYNDGSIYMWHDTGFYSHANRGFVFWGPVWNGLCMGHLDPSNSKQMFVYCSNKNDPASAVPCCRYNYQLQE